MKHFLLKVFILVISCSCFLPLNSFSLGKDTINFIHITDIHVCDLTRAHPFIKEKRKHFGNNEFIFRNFINPFFNKYPSDFVVITGDHIDFFEGIDDNGEMRDLQIENFTRLINKIHIPTYLTLGNHDIASYYIDSTKNSYQSIQHESMKARSAWIRNASCFRDGTYYSRVFRVGSTEFRFIFLDNAYYNLDRGDNGLSFEISKEQLHWLEKEINDSDSDVEILFMHMPLLPIDNNTVLNKDNLPVVVQESELFKLLGKTKSNRLLFVGHNHRNIIKKYQYSSGEELIQVMTGAFGYDANDWRSIKLSENSISIGLPGDTAIEYVIDLYAE